MHSRIGEVPARAGAGREASERGPGAGERFLSFQAAAARIPAVRDLIREPACRPEDLGTPIPDSPHACLVCLPTWDAVIGYEEGRPDVVDKLRAGYPRFFLHPRTSTLFAEIEKREGRGNERAVVFPSAVVAERAQRFVAGRHGNGGRVVDLGGLHAVLVPEECHESARDYWRHTGELVSSRQAEDFMAGALASGGAREGFRSAMAEVLMVAPPDCFILESGMAAIFTLFRIATRRQPGKKTLQLCFPYVDALKVQEHFGTGVDFQPCDEEGELAEALSAIRAGSYAAVFCEVPSNPLLGTVDLPAVSAACRESGTLLFVDDTVCSHHNVDALPWADAVSTSLTKWVSGIGDVMAGSIKLNAGSVLAGELRAALEGEVPAGSRLYPRDAEVLEANAHGLEARVKAASRGGEAIAEFLAGHPEVGRILYPGMVDRANYDALRRPDGGYGALMSFVLKEPAQAPAFFDAVEISKGPSLGTEYSLICPYTMLAHYTELDWAARYGVSGYLLRLSVGLEPPEELINRLEAAFQSVATATPGRQPAR